MNPNEIDLDALTRDEKSALVYAETCLVDYGGLLEGIRMNEHDIAAFNRFQTEGLLTWGRVPGAMLGTFARKVTHWITFNDGAWILAHRLRRARAGRSTSSRQEVDAYLDERETA
jgi:hypothetical protein